MEPWFLEAIKALGVAGGPVFAALWWLERTERRECQKTVKELMVQTLTVTTHATHSVESVGKAVAELRGSLRESVTTLAQTIRAAKKL